MNNTVKTYVQGSTIRLTTIVFAIFLFCKLAGYINWPWWLVIAPLLVTPAIVLVLVLMSVGCFGIAAIISHYRNR